MSIEHNERCARPGKGAERNDEGSTLGASHRSGHCRAADRGNNGSRGAAVAGVLFVVMVITPHIVVQVAERAASFYRDAFGGEEIERIPTPDGRLMSVQLRIGDGVLHVADEFPELGVLAPPSIGGTPVVLSLEVDDADAAFTRAMAAGATVRQPLMDTFWGDRHGQLGDPFGHRWNVSHHVRDVPHDEVVAAAAQLFS
jgi:PhnB protein